MTKTIFIFPHQLFVDHPALGDGNLRIRLIEEPLFYDDPQYPAAMHKQKIWLHRASMKRYCKTLSDTGHTVIYDDYRHDRKMLSKIVDAEKTGGTNTITVCDLHDFTLSKRLQLACDHADIELEVLDTPGFLNSNALNTDYRAGKKRWFMADFYKWQRTRLDVMVDKDGKPDGGKWSFDDDNRKKVPKNKLADIPHIASRKPDAIEQEAKDYVESTFENNPGDLKAIWYPTAHKDAEEWFSTFLHERFHLFGDYEDAIVEGENWLWHSVLTPMLNTGLLTPRYVVNETLAFAQKHQVPLNSVEGFIRQIIGWREFMRATYVDLGIQMRTTNHWGHTNKLPQSFYDGTTGIDPIDDTIRRINETAYCHHIERLMVLGGFMFLCEIDPDDIYRWFMEMFIDSYDWVMVPNAYAMSQNADGGLITTKPYFSGSAYVKKMSHYKHGPWADVWDGLYWRWIWNHRAELGKNPRWAMMCRTAERMAPEKIEAHLTHAEDFLTKHIKK